MTTCWQLPNNKSYIRIDRNGLNTAIGASILRTFYPDAWHKLNTPIEQRNSFIDLQIQLNAQLVKGEPPTGMFMPNPDLVYYNVQGTGTWHPFNKTQSPHRFMVIATEHNKGVLHALIRHPFQRFISFINRYTLQLHNHTPDFNITKCIDDAVIHLQNTPSTEIFQYNNKQLIPQSTFLNDNYKSIKFYQYPNHVNELIADLSIQPPQKEKSTLIQSIHLNSSHEEVVSSKYKKDLDLFEAIRHAGIILEV